MDNLLCAYTRDTSLYFNEWLDEIIYSKTKAIFGVGQENVFISDGLTCQILRPESQRSLLKHAILKKLAAEREFYLICSAEFRKEVSVAKQKIQELKTTDLTPATIAGFKNCLASLYPWFIPAVFLPAKWKEDFSKLYGQGAEKVVKQAYADRLFSEGLWENTDLFLRKLCADKLKQLVVPPSLAKFVNSQELETLANRGVISLEQLLKRKKGYLYLRGKLYLANNYGAILAAHGFSYACDVSSSTSLFGEVAFNGGIVTGKVRKIFSTDQLGEFTTGEVLVSPMTVPDFLPAMKKAIAIVTDEGGITCHAAIVSRELKKPCVIGTKTATRVLKNGDEVQVDSTKGIVTKL
ncbi:MAG: PEP-utilizing enzyme [Candidatus Micrarchaeota archaeon]